MTKGKRWADIELPLGDIRQHQDFQFRVEGISQANLNGIVRTLEDGGAARDPVRVARVGERLYLVDGAHRLEAYRKAGRLTIPAKVAKMNLGEARDYALSSNAMNGKPYSRADKAKVFSTYIAQERHLDALGVLKSSRTIAAELGGGLYSHETIRKKLKALGLELDEDTEYPGGYFPMMTEEDLAEDLAEDAETHLRAFGALVGDLEALDRARLLKAARSVLEAAERGERPDMATLLPIVLLDI